MEALRLPTEKEIRALYQLGEDETVALIMNLLQNYQALAERVQRLEARKILKNAADWASQHLTSIAQPKAHWRLASPASSACFVGRH